jgi:hypothetical protein
MNRHDRRAAEAQARAASAQIDKGFEAYRAQAKRAFRDLDDKKIGEYWMRGQAWTATGADAMVVHRPGETPERHDDDIAVSATYGDLKFKAFISKPLLHEGTEHWRNFITDFAANNKPHDPRAGSRTFILRILIEQSHTRGDEAAMMVAAIGWLTATSPAGPLFEGGESPPRIHYEITDITDGAGRRGQNFRLVLNNAPDAPLPEWVKTAPRY